MERQALSSPSPHSYSGAALCFPQTLLSKLNKPCSSGGSSQTVQHSWPSWGTLCTSCYLFLYFWGAKNQRHGECWVEGIIPSQSTLKQSTWAARCQRLSPSTLLELLLLFCSLGTKGGARAISQKKLSKRGILRARLLCQQNDWPGKKTLHQERAGGEVPAALWRGMMSKGNTKLTEQGLHGAFSSMPT